MSQSTVACYIVHFTALPNDDAVHAELRRVLQHAGFATIVADVDGIPHHLAADCYALTSVQDKSDVERLAQALGQQALGQTPRWKHCCARSTLRCCVRPGRRPGDHGHNA